jgi:ubiquitin-like-conjugating enzyme ATG3
VEVVSSCCNSRFQLIESSPLRQTGDASKVRDYLQPDKQYLLTRGVPCLRRATSLAYTDADEDAERLLNFGDTSSTGNEVDEWVETHAGRKGTTDNADNAGDIDDIPDLDGPGEATGITNTMGSMSLGAGTTSAGAGAAGEIPDMDEIPDMEEEDLEAGDDEATAAPNVAVSTVNATDASYVSPSSKVPGYTDFLSILAVRGLKIVICCKCERTMS